MGGGGGDGSQRIIGTVKRSLKKNIGMALLTKEELLTVIVEIEAVVNNNACMTSFWRCWREEYLLNPRECHQSNIQKKQDDRTA